VTQQVVVTQQVSETNQDTLATMFREWVFWLWSWPAVDFVQLLILVSR